MSYPMLALFRSQHAGQSWITALGVVTDAATLTCACVVGAELREPYFLHRRGRRTVAEIADRLHVRQSSETEWLTPANFDSAWALLSGLGLPLRDKAEAWQRLREFRGPYGDRLEQLIDYLMAPRGFWGHSAEATVADESRASYCGSSPSGPEWRWRIATPTATTLNAQTGTYRPVPYLSEPSKL